MVVVGIELWPLSSSAFQEDVLALSGKRIGIIGSDTSGNRIFTEKINNGGAQMSGFRVVAAYPQGSKDIPVALKMKRGIIDAVKEKCVEIITTIDELLEKVDVVSLESIDGRTSL